MHGKIRHECWRCGFQWVERTSGIGEELAEWIQHADAIDAEARTMLARTVHAYEKRLAQLEHALTAVRNDVLYLEALREYEKRLESVPF